MKHTIGTATVLGLTLSLAACGGSGGSSDPDIDADAGLPDTVVPADDIVDDSEDGTPVADEGLEATDDLVCSSHTQSSATTIGNNIYTYEASDGQCFGTREASADVDRRLVPVDAILELRGDATEQMLSVEPEARMVINPGNSFLLGDVTKDTLLIDVTNTHGAPICVQANEMEILDAAGGVVLERYADMAGDQYQSLTESGNTSRLYGCIPAGESRYVFGQWLTTASNFEGEVLPDYTRVQLTLQVEVPEADAVPAEPLIPGELTWSAYAPDEDSFGSYPVNSSLTVRNDSEQSVSISRHGDVLYLDDENYLIHWERLDMEDYAELNGFTYTDEDKTLAASGGIAGFSTSQFFNIDVSGESGTGFDSPASRAMVYVEQQCVGESC